MCGICGTVTHESPGLLRSMLDAMKHRGPDEEGSYCDEKLKISLGIKRLSIIDPETGSQPLFNEDKSIVLVTNGEIYNYRELKKDLIKNNHIFKTNADGEVIVHLFEEKGIDAVNSLRGMFAFALLDKNNETLFLVRDRLGMKPLYFSKNGRKIIFASEIKALLASGIINPDINPEALELFLSFPAVPAPLTIIKGIEAILPAHYIEFKKNRLKKIEYWKLQDHLPPHKRSEKLKPREKEEKLGELVENAVKEHMISDVPLGSFLSGGIDSTTISYFASRYSNNSLKTFSIGFHLDSSMSENYNELSQASVASKKLQTNHHEKIITTREITNALPHIIYAMDQPTGNGINSYFISKVAKKKVKVALSGTGGDELFGGYPWFSQIIANYKLLEKWGKIPEPLKIPLRKILTSTKPGGNIPDTLSPKKESQFEKAYRYTRWLMLDNLKKKLLKPDFFKDHLKNDDFDPINFHAKCTRNTDIFSKITFLQLKYDMPDLLLRDCDAMSMSHSIEVRLPFLDHRIVEFAMSIPPKDKIEKGNYKAILRKSMKNYLPAEIVSRKKQGFIFLKYG